jgi:hypothetical protein
MRCKPLSNKSNEKQGSELSLPCSYFVCDILDDYDILGLQAFLALDNGEFYALSFIQVAVSIADNGIVMDE